MPTKHRSITRLSTVFVDNLNETYNPKLGPQDVLSYLCGSTGLGRFKPVVVVQLQPFVELA